MGIPDYKQQSNPFAHASTFQGQMRCPIASHPCPPSAVVPEHSPLRIDLFAAPVAIAIGFGDVVQPLHEIMNAGDDEKGMNPIAKRRRAEFA